MTIDPKMLLEIFKGRGVNLERAEAILNAWQARPWEQSMKAQFCDSLKEGTPLADAISIMCCMWLEIGYILAVYCPHCKTEHYPHCGETTLSNKMD